MGGRGQEGLAARKVRHRAAEASLLDRDKAKPVLHGRETRRKSRRPSSDDDDIMEIRPSQSIQRAHGIDRLATLLDGVADETHAAELTGDEHTRYIGLEVGADMGNVDAALLGAEDQADGVARACRPAGAVADAVRWFDEHGLAVDEPENLALRTSPNASAASDAAGGVDLRMQRRRLQQPGFRCCLALRDAAPLGLLAQPEIDDPNDRQGQGIEYQQRIG